MTYRERIFRIGPPVCCETIASRRGCRNGQTNLQFDFYSSNNTLGQLQDPFVGVNPFTGVDDTFGTAEDPLSTLIEKDYPLFAVH